MESNAWRPRLIDEITRSYAQCWEPAPNVAILDAADAELRVVTLADLVLPFEAAGLLHADQSIGGVTPATIRRAVLERQLNERFMSVGCQVAAAEQGDIIFRDEMAREWATWLSYCMRVHAPEFREALVLLRNTVGALEAYRRRPTRRAEERGAGGEVLSSIVPIDAVSGSDFDVIEPLLDRCAVIASVLDSIRRKASIFSELIGYTVPQRMHRPDEFVLDAPFHPFLWPYSLDALQQVVQIARGIKELGRAAVVDDEEGDAVSIGSTSRMRT